MVCFGGFSGVLCCGGIVDISRGLGGIVMWWL